MMGFKQIDAWAWGTATAVILGCAGTAWAVAEVETPAAVELEEAMPPVGEAAMPPVGEAAMPPVGTEPAPRVMPKSMEETAPAVERRTLPDPAVTSQPATETTGRVERSAFTREVLDREPLGEVGALENDATQVAYFTELRGLDGHQVTHVWEFNGESMAEVAFEVRGERWRVHSTKKLDPAWLGTWSVLVLDADGRELSRETFDYVEVGQAPADSASMPASAAPSMP